MKASNLHKRGKRVHLLRIERTRGTEGPRHDPYSYETTWAEYSNNTRIGLRIGCFGSALFIPRTDTKWYLGRHIRINARDDAGTERLVARFERLVGLSMKQIERLVERSERAYDEDPMGNLSQYI